MSNTVNFIAYALSSATIILCLFLKVPQIIVLLQSQSVQGMHVQAMLMEIFGFTIVTLYNFMNDYKLMTYLEYPIILIQIYVMLFIVLKFKNLIDNRLVPLGVVVYLLTVFCFLWGFIPTSVLNYLVPMCTPLSGFAKVSYIYGIINAENADAVSLTTWSISVFTNLARLFTVYMDSADLKLMLNFVISACLSGCVLVTAMYYKRYCDEHGPRGYNQELRRRRVSKRLYRD